MDSCLLSCILKLVPRLESTSQTCRIVRRHTFRTLVKKIFSITKIQNKIKIINLHLMKNKLRLAIISIILPFVLQFILNKFNYTFSDGFGFGLRDSLYFLINFCTLGTLPFFISLYKSKEFNALMENENTVSSGKDDNWIKHILIRIGIILGICLAFLSLSLVSSGMSTGYLIMYGIVATIGVSFTVLVIESIVLARKKLWNKLYCNIVIIGFLFFFGINLL